MKVDKTYVFHTLQSEKTLGELFLGRSQLIVYHLMFGPEWKTEYSGCSFLSDHLYGALPHLEYHDAFLVAVSLAPLAKIEAYERRMGWRFPWVSVAGSDCNHDYHVSFSPEELASGEVFYNITGIPTAVANNEISGLIAFSKGESGAVCHTYFSYAGGHEEVVGALMILDCAPLGRNEDRKMDWMLRHDEYEHTPPAPLSWRRLDEGFQPLG